MDSILIVFRCLVNQCENHCQNNNLIILAWLFTAFIILVFFSGGVHESIVNNDNSKIDSMDDLIASNLTAFITNNSWLHSVFDGVTKYNNTLDQYLMGIERKVKFLDRDEVFYKEVYLINKFNILLIFFLIKKI